MILDEIAAATRLRVEQLQRIKDLNKIRSDAESLPKNNRGFRTRLSRDGMNFITEVKKASPSKGIISKEFDYLRLARDYEAAGAAAGAGGENPAGRSEFRAVAPDRAGDSGPDV